jgi:23S rRNA (adenine2503-C2)-methyltransferase
MLTITKRLDDPSGVVSKLVFEGTEGAIVETVAYRYQDRGVICFSCQSGCPIGCTFCGTGKKFIRSLSADEMAIQIESARMIIGGDLKKIQLMSMSMGEPFLNLKNVYDVALFYLERDFYFYISTVGLKMTNDLIGRPGSQVIQTLAKFKKFGLQFSLHEISDEERSKIIPYRSNSMTIKEMIDAGRRFCNVSGNRAYYNFIMRGDESKERKEEILKFMLNNLDENHHVTFSVLCDTKKLSKADPQIAIEMANRLFSLSKGKIETSSFDPAGQDTIGGGCGQLLYVQEKLNGRCSS